MSTAQGVRELADMLERAGKRPRVGENGKGKALCPCHEDHAPSFEFGAGNRTPVVGRCMSCNATLPEALDALGASPEQRDVILGGTAQTRSKPSNPVPPTAYLYQDEFGEPLYQSLRFDLPAGKQFKYRRWTRDGWQWGLEDTRRVLYRLPEVAAAIARGDTVFVAEGEKCVDAVRRLGLTCTTAPTGSNGWREEFGEMLRGAKSVIVFADHDEPGAAYAAAVAATATRVAVPDVRVIVFTDLPPKADVADWLAGLRCEAEQARVRLLERCAATENPVTRFSAACISASELRRRVITPRPSLLGDRILPAGGFGIMFGQPGTHKSWLGLMMARAIARGEDWLGIPALAGGTRCGVMQLELEDELIQERLAVLGIGDHPLDENLGIVCRPILRGPVDLMNGDFAALRRLIDDHAFRFLVLDAVSRFHVLDENDNRDMGLLAAGIDTLREATGCAILLIHHPRKSNQQSRDDDDDMDALRGAGRIGSDARLVIRVKKTVGEMRKVVFAKVSTGPTPDPIHFQPTEHGPVRCDAPGEASTKRGQANRDRVMEAIRQAAGGKISVAGLVPVVGMSKSTVQDHVAGLVQNGQVTVTHVSRMAFYSAAGPDRPDTESGPDVSLFDSND